MKHLEYTRSLTSLGLVATLAAGAGLLLHQQSVAGPEPAVRDNARELSRAFRDVARNISPSVVNVLAIHDAPDLPARAQRLNPHGDLEPFLRFFGGGEDDSQNPFQVPVPSQGQGTGVIVDANGLIATNNHVVAGATRLEVTLQDGRKLPAEVVGTDPETDLAVVRVKEKGLPAAKLGDSTQLEPGDWVVAVGNPFGLDHTVTVGVVSAMGRSGIGVANYEDFIQTDAAINPGNSGGPLLNLDGEVIGINTAIRTSNGGSDGISFAVPSATLKNVLPGLESEGHVSRGWLGVSLQPLTPELASSFGAKGAQGALIAEVIDDTPASKAGLRAGDIVTSIGGKNVNSSRELSSMVAALAPGTQADLRVLRDGTETKLSLTLGERPAKDALERHAAESETHGGSFGLRLGDVPQALARSMDVSGGALVREVQPGSPADEAGLRAGDVVLSVGSHEVASAEDGLRDLRDAEDGARLLVRTQDGSTRWVFLKRASNE